jgi:formate/nitrite transporter FocA (FNT family)
LVCLAAWLALAGRNVVDKIFAIIFLISAFVAAGFEHSIANMYFIPLGILVQEHFPAAGSAALNWPGLLSNLIPSDHRKYRRGRRNGSGSLLSRLLPSRWQLKISR